MKLIGLFLMVVGVFVSITFGQLFAFDHSHQNWQLVLDQSVVLEGRKSWVDYRLLSRDQMRLNDYLTEISSVTQSEYDAWESSQRLAFLINAYNALTIQLILTEYPDLKSIKDLGGLFSSPWKKKFFNLLGESRYLDYIEHEMLRKDFNEPRIHFAIVCASIGCPPLRKEAFLADRIDDQLQRAMVNFLSDADKNQVNQAENRLELSPIFKWFSEDFEKATGSVQAFVIPWIPFGRDTFDGMEADKIPIDYLPYDWALNDINR